MRLGLKQTHTSSSASLCHVVFDCVVTVDIQELVHDINKQQNNHIKWKRKRRDCAFVMLSYGNFFKFCIFLINKTLGAEPTCAFMSVCEICM